METETKKRLKPIEKRPMKRQGLVAHGILGDLNINLQTQQEVVGNAAVAAAEFEKKSTQNRALNKSDTGIAGTSIPIEPSGLPLWLERPTASNDTNDATTAGDKNKYGQNMPDINKRKKMPVQNDYIGKPLIPILKQLTKSLEKMKLAASSSKMDETTSVMNQTTVSVEKMKLAASSSKSDETTSKTVLPDPLNLDVSVPQLPADIEDIDAHDTGNPMLMSIYIQDIYNHLRELEIKYPIEQDHLRKQSVITGDMRAAVVDWLVTVQTELSLVLETFHLAVGILDRYLQVAPDIPKDRLQLVAITAMFIAVKYEEKRTAGCSTSIFIVNAYCRDDIFPCEREIMSKLNFCLSRPIQVEFLKRFVKAARGSKMNYQLSKYFVDLSLVEYSMAHYHPSELAAAAICLSLHLFSKKSLKELWTPTLSYYTGYSLEHIDPIIRKIAKIVINVEHCKYKAVYRKYLHPAEGRVSSLPQLKGKIVCELANVPPSS